MTMDKKYSEKFFLSAGETNAEAEASLPLLTSKIIDISTAHANLLGIGNPSMASLGCGWVLSRIALEMFRYPRVNEEYRLTTWIESFNRHFSERIVEISTVSGESLGFSRAIWMVLDYNTHESVGLGHLNIPDTILCPGECPIGRQGKHVAVVMPTEGAEMPRGCVQANAPAFRYRYKYCDLDFYRHVNTVRYVELLLNRLPLSLLDSTRVRRMELAFLREGKYDEEVEVLRRDEEPVSYFSIVEPGAAQPSLVAQLIREPRAR